MIKELLTKCVGGETFTEQEAEMIMDFIMSGEATSSQIASIISIMRFRGETVPEMIGFAKSMRSHMKVIEYEGELIDTCGTGGDGTSTFNISTAVAIVISSLNVKVAKHGNRSVSSKSGSADVLEKLGIPIQSNEAEVFDALDNKKMSFLFAPVYHSAMKNAVTPRKELGFRTIFNLLGPMSNPAQCKKQIIGVYDTTYAEKMAQTLDALGSTHVLLVTGRDGLDECSITTETDVVELKNGEISRFTLAPEDVGLKRGKLEDIQVASSEESAKLISDILSGKANESATNIVAINAGAALYVAGKVDTISEGVHLAKKAIVSQDVNKHFQVLRNETERKNYA